jgi:hypothetical protein
MSILESILEEDEDVPELLGILSSLSEETIALKDSESSEFEEENLNEKVDLIATTLGSKPPTIPLREERLSLGVECVFKAKGVGMSGVRKISKNKRRQRRRIKKEKRILSCVTECAPFVMPDEDKTPKNDNTTRKLKSKNLKALTYDQYFDYLSRCNAKGKVSIEHPYLELEKSRHEGELKKRVFTRELTGSADEYQLEFVPTSDSATIVTSHVVAMEEPTPQISNKSYTRLSQEDENYVKTDLLERIPQVESQNLLCLAPDNVIVSETIATNTFEKKSSPSKKMTSKKLSTSRGNSIMDSVGDDGCLIEKITSMKKDVMKTISEPVQEELAIDCQESRDNVEGDRNDMVFARTPTFEILNTGNEERFSFYEPKRQEEVIPASEDEFQLAPDYVNDDNKSMNSSASSIEESPSICEDERVDESNVEFTIPKTLSLESCHSSVYTEERAPSIQDNKSTISRDSFGLADLIPHSFSMDSFKSNKSVLTMRSNRTEKTSRSFEEAEQCITHSLSELARIHDKIQAEKMEENAECMSCQSESTDGRDNLFWARQSKNEIAALQNLIEKQIVEEQDGGYGIEQSFSFGTVSTMSTMKSKMTAAQVQSMDKLINEVNHLCSKIENRIENIVKDTGSNDE